MPKTPSHIEHLVRRGAEVRFHELVDELKNLTAAFPHLRDTISADELPIAFVLKKDAQAAARRRSSGGTSSRKARNAKKR